MNKFNLFTWLRSSLDNSKEGASGKKMAAFWIIMFVVTPIVVCWAIWALMRNDWKLLPETLGSLLWFATGCLGINGAEKILDKFSKKTPSDETTNTLPGANSNVN